MKHFLTKIFKQIKYYILVLFLLEFCFFLIDVFVFLCNKNIELFSILLDTRTQVFSFTTSLIFLILYHPKS